MSESNGNHDLHVFDTGAVRTEEADDERYDLITPIGLERVARIYAEGATKYGPSAWEKGLPISDLMNHGLRHWRLYASGDRSEDHLAKMAWAAMAACHSEEMWPELNTDLRRCVEGQLNIPSTVDDETAGRRRRLRANLEAMKADVRRAAEDAELAPADWPHIPPAPPAARFASPPRVPTRYLLVVPDDSSPGCAMNLSEGLRRAGFAAEVSAFNSSFLDADLHACDAAVLWRGNDEPGLLERIRAHGKPLIVIGPCPDDFPRHGTGERWYPSWSSFLQSLDVVSAHDPITSAR